MMDGSFLINAIYDGEIEIEHDIYREESNRDYWDEHPYFRKNERRITTKTQLIPISATFVLTVKDKKLLNLEMEDWDFA